MEEARSSERGHKPKPIKVKVTFPLAGKEHYESKDAPETRVEQVRIAAMNHFGLADDDSAIYYLTHGRNRPDPEDTIGAIAGGEHSVKFSLVKQLIQG